MRFVSWLLYLRGCDHVPAVSQLDSGAVQQLALEPEPSDYVRSTEVGFSRAVATHFKAKIEALPVPGWPVGHRATLEAVSTHFKVWIEGLRGRAPKV